MINIKKVAEWLGRTQGRDKLCKILQYASRFQSTNYPKDSFENLQYTTIYNNIRQGRRLFRLFKSIFEYQQVLRMIFQGQEDLPNILQILSTFFYFLYWVFDNISVASEVKIFRLNHMKYYQIGIKFRICGLLAKLASIAAGLKIKNYSKQRKQVRMSFIRIICDLIHSLKDSNLIKKYFNIQMNEKIVAIAGLTSAVITSYQIYNQK